MRTDRHTYDTPTDRQISPRPNPRRSPTSKKILLRCFKIRATGIPNEWNSWFIQKLAAFALLALLQRGRQKFDPPFLLSHQNILWAYGMNFLEFFCFSFNIPTASSRESGRERHCIPFLNIFTIRRRELFSTFLYVPYEIFLQPVKLINRSLNLKSNAVKKWKFMIRAILKSILDIVLFLQIKVCYRGNFLDCWMSWKSLIATSNRIGKRDSINRVVNRVVEFRPLFFFFFFFFFF